MFVWILEEHWLLAGEVVRFFLLSNSVTLKLTASADNCVPSACQSIFSRESYPVAASNFSCNSIYFAIIVFHFPRCIFRLKSAFCSDGHARKHWSKSFCFSTFFSIANWTFILRWQIILILHDLIIIIMTSLYFFKCQSSSQRRQKNEPFYRLIRVEDTKFVHYLR